MRDLQQKYPEILGNVSIDCSEGWYTLLDNLCASIQSHMEYAAKNAERWGEEPPEAVVAVQVKEKYGGLRFYYDGGDEFVRGLTSMAETMSEYICEVCGNAGKQRSNRWVSTLCDLHYDVPLSGIVVSKLGDTID